MMLNAVWVLVRARLLIIRNTLWRGSLRSKIGLVALLGLIGLGAFGLYGLSRVIAAGLRSEEFAEILREAAAVTPELPSDITPYLTAVPGAALFGALVLLVLSSFGGLLNTLYLSGDIDMLLVAPVPMRAVFTVKFFAALGPLYAALLGLLGPALIGYGLGLGYGAGYVIMALLVLLLLPLIPAGSAHCW
ncbi:MAG: hypothetical protein HC822_25365 [Oscillochloris sp.]|nr:hypothetical protein [Oscillochloris sp.]